MAMKAVAPLRKPWAWVEFILQPSSQLKAASYAAAGHMSSPNPSATSDQFGAVLTDMELLLPCVLMPKGAHAL